MQKGRKTRKTIEKLRETLEIVENYGKLMERARKS